MSHLPAEKPDLCPVCETAYSFVTGHADGLLTGLEQNERPVCLLSATHR